ncbi:SAYSvFN domain-containing protein 1 [Tachyglossus aculeatus]|uniref:SAYSvFN domain-containing protein 1 n=1 Tax=Tachyglossus aculeatus TaxID=9261 RepID=UPI0018F7BD0E|nr:SAYSvFN domain-containing protein 1 [Tachyglossus aculeatus]
MERRLAEFRASRKRVDGNHNGAEAEPVRTLRPGQEAAQTPGSSAEAPAPAGSSPAPRSRCPPIVLTLLKVLLWLVLLGLFVELEFGLPYFVLSLFYWIYVGTRGPGEKKEGEWSAYSVFNPGYEAIQGTLTAEQLERQLLNQPLAGR